MSSTPILGRIILDLAPTAENQRNSEGAFIRMSNGSIAFAYTRYRSGFADSATADLAVCFSHDGGKSFSEPRIFLTPEECENARNIMSVSLLELTDGSIAVFYLKKFGKFECIPFVRTTRDFVTLSKERACTDKSGYFVVANDRVRRLSNGSIVIPVAGMIHPEGGPAGGFENEYSWVYPPSQGFFLISNDECNGFEWSEILDCPFEICLHHSEKGLQEPGVVELNDGRLYTHYRNMTGRQLETLSSDGGYTWSRITPSRFTSPPSPMSTLKLRDGNILVGYNPAPLYFGRGQTVDGVWTGGRTPYVLEIADGSMSPLIPPRAIENDERSGFGYCAMLETDDAILLGYCAGGVADGCMLNRLRIRRIEKGELYPSAQAE